jgi:hypothetical protein
MKPNLPNPEIQLPDSFLPILKWISITPGRTLAYTAAWTQLVVAVVIVFAGAPIDILLYTITAIPLIHHLLKVTRIEHDKIASRVQAQTPPK